MNEEELNQNDFLSDRVIVEGNNNENNNGNIENNSERELEEFFIEQNKLKEKPKKRKFGIDRDSDVRIFEEDIEEEEINVDLDSNGRLLDDELLNFISVYFSDDIFYSSNFQNYKHIASYPEINRSGSRIVWFENSKTGELMPVARRVTTSASPALDGDKLDTNDLEDGGNAQSVSKDSEEITPLLNSYPPPLVHPNYTFNDGNENSGNENIDNSHDVVGKVIHGGIGTPGAAVGDETSRITKYNNLVSSQRVLFLFFQGLLSGFVFTALYSQILNANSDADLLSRLQLNAEEYRRLFYILTTLSAIGSIDLVLTIIKSRATAKLHSQLISLKSGNASSHYNRTMSMISNSNQYSNGALVTSIIIALLYAVVYILTIVMTSEDILIATQDGYGSYGSDWTTYALNDSLFSSRLTTWKICNLIRFILAIFAWIGSCWFVWKDMTFLNKKTEALYRLNEVTAAWVSRVNLMEGDEGLEKLNQLELKKLASILKIGLDRANEALKYFGEDEADLKTK